MPTKPDPGFVLQSLALSRSLSLGHLKTFGVTISLLIGRKCRHASKSPRPPARGSPFSKGLRSPYHGTCPGLPVPVILHAMSIMAGTMHDRFVTCWSLSRHPILVC